MLADLLQKRDVRGCNLPYVPICRVLILYYVYIKIVIVITASYTLYTGSSQWVCRRFQSSFLQTIDQTLQLSTANPLYQGAHGLFELVHTTTGNCL